MSGLPIQKKNTLLLKKETTKAPVK